MEEKAKENPLLYSASASPFDNISSALLLPPSPATTAVVSGSSDKNGSNPSTKSSSLTPADALLHSLQPHLDGQIHNAPTSDITPSAIPLLNPPMAYANAPSLHTMPTEFSSVPKMSAPPVRMSQGNSMLRRPTTGKYVIPPEISHSPQGSTGPAIFTPQPPTSSPVVPTDGICSNPVQNITNAEIPQMYPSIPPSFDAMASNPPIQGQVYLPVTPHWFHTEGKSQAWKPFSLNDSLKLEEAFLQGSTDLIATDGGRYDVSIQERKKTPVYWDAESPGLVRRCTWFRRSYSEPLPVPYDETAADKLEEEFKDAMVTGRWHRQVQLPGGEIVMINSALSMHHYLLQESTEFPNTVSISDAQQTPQTVRRGAEDFPIIRGSSDRVDHLLFVIHGIGTFCDLSFRSINECVDDFRSIGEELLATHFKESFDGGKIGRVEILPIAWHKALHGEATGLDRKLKVITLRSIPKFRDFTNDTLLDILFYTSPVYCQHIMNTVADEMAKLHRIFLRRNPTFNGGVSLAGHSLGSVILFDLLLHQNPGSNPSEEGVTEETPNERESRQSKPPINFEMGSAGTGQPAIIYPQLSFRPQALFLLGSPVGMFFTVRGIDKLSPDFELPTCNRVFNIFHPFDPVAYRIETLIDETLIDLRPVLVPHHKGRKRMHLELKDTLERVGSDLKNKIMESIQTTWNKFYQIYAGSTSDGTVTQEVFEEHMTRLNEEAEAEQQPPPYTLRIGKLNRGERIDYALQEKPYESFTEYIFALQAHLTYWKSEDTLLMILKELFKIQNVFPDTRLRRESLLSASSSSFAPSNQFGPTNSYEPPTQTQRENPPVPLLPSTPQGADNVPFLPSPSGAMLPPVGVIGAEPQRSMRGRPVVDINSMQVMGIDPTASPTGSSALGPPPIVSNVSFNRKSAT